MEEEKAQKEALVSDLALRRQKIIGMGGPERIASQKKKNKLTARERIDLLMDSGTFHELWMFGTSRGNLGPDKSPADGVVTGYGQVNGRTVYVYSQDFTTQGGTLAETHANKICMCLDAAMKAGCPVIGINDSGGARIQDGVDALAGFGNMFYRNTMASGVIPQICAIMGPCAGGAVYSPALMDFVFMVKGSSYAYITGPRVVKAVLGQEVNDEDLGGAAVAQRKAGVCCRAENSDQECLDAIKELLGYLPRNNREKPAGIDWGDKPDRRDATIFDLVPSNPVKPYDMRKIIARTFDLKPDGGKNNFELFPDWAKNIITCFARLNGHAIGIIANQPWSKAGCLDIDASDKASRFIRFCDAFNIPLVTIVDVPGYLPGTDQEWGGIIRHGAKMLFAYSEATVPKITVVLRKAYGGAYIGMCSRGLGADVVMSWPSGELAVMGPDGAAPIIYRKELEKAADPQAALQEKIAEYRKQFANPYLPAMHLHVDDIIDPADTRLMLVRALEAHLHKEESRPRKKHSIMPA
ncbi:MAG: acyl-CoA carboxylase subunit beta [Dehalococcoidales bacterium]|nr:acyl-CoA carboxylase subunit beta [Dehalococcoidales bacterium]